MSKIGRMPIKIPENVTVKQEGHDLIVEGPLGKLRQKTSQGINVKIKEGEVLVERKRSDKKIKALHGLNRSLIANMVEGVTQGFKRILELHGTGYRANTQDKDLVLQLGFSHPVTVKAPEGIKFDIKEKEIIVSGPDKRLVGQIAADIRAIKKPEVYKGKGIRWKGETIKLKPGKAAKLGEAGQG